MKDTHDMIFLMKKMKGKMFAFKKYKIYPSVQSREGNEGVGATALLHSYVCVNLMKTKMECTVKRQLRSPPAECI